MATSKPPAWLGDLGILEWKKRAPEYFETEETGTAIVERFARYCDALAKWNQCRLYLEGKDDLSYITENSSKPWPEVAIYRQLVTTISAMEKDLGIIED